MKKNTNYPTEPTVIEKGGLPTTLSGLLLKKDRHRQCRHLQRAAEIV